VEEEEKRGELLSLDPSLATVKGKHFFSKGRKVECMHKKRKK
jgi:hypothetical protein